jgi:centromeric protein E
VCRLSCTFGNVSKLTETVPFGTQRSATVVPYRESKLTQILQPSLSGSARVVLIAAINPHPVSVEETKSTLKFAARVKKVVVAAEKNEVVDKETLIVHYKSQIAELEAQLAEAKRREAMTSVPPTSTMSSSAEMMGSAGSGRRRDSAEARKRKKEQAAENELIEKQIARLGKLFLNSSNIDDVREGGGPRPVSPTKPSVKLDAEQVRPCGGVFFLSPRGPFDLLTRSENQLHEQLLDEKDKCAQLEDEVALLRSENSRLFSRRTIPIDAPLHEKDKRIRELEQEVAEMEVVLQNQGGEVIELELAKEKKRAERAEERWQVAETKLKNLEKVMEEERKKHEAMKEVVIMLRGRTRRWHEEMMGNSGGGGAGGGRPSLLLPSEASLAELPSLQDEMPHDMDLLGDVRLSMAGVALGDGEEES